MLAIAQVSSSFKCLDTCTFTYATPTFTTERSFLLAQVQPLLKTNSELTPYTAIVYSYWVIFHDAYDKATPIKDIDYIQLP